MGMRVGECVIMEFDLGGALETGRPTWKEVEMRGMVVRKKREEDREGTEGGEEEKKRAGSRRWDVFCRH